MEHGDGEPLSLSPPAADEQDRGIESGDGSLSAESAEKHGAGEATARPLSKKKNLQPKGTQSRPKGCIKAKSAAHLNDSKAKKNNVGITSRPKVLAESHHSSAEECSANNTDTSNGGQDETDPASKVRDSQDDSLSSKPRKAANMPSYGFTFKCDERAEKRREFYSKIEEKIHAKELEKSSLEAKSKESEEAELKMLRKSLNFKATPMPSFYQEPPPPRVQLKKIPTTRAKSPKFGRNKASLSAVESEQSSCHPGHPACKSLDDRKAAGNCTAKVIPLQANKQHRKSLPRLRSQGAAAPIGVLSNPDQNTQPSPAPVIDAQSEEKEDGDVEQELCNRMLRMNA